MRCTYVAFFTIGGGVVGIIGPRVGTFVVFLSYLCSRYSCTREIVSKLSFRSFAISL